MRLFPKTWVLLALTGLLAVANAWTMSPAAAPSELPSLPAVVPDEVTRIVISSPIDRLEIDRTAFVRGHPESERWDIVAPLEYAADVAQVRALLRIYGTGVSMDARVDSGNLKDYQLEDQDAKVVELYTDGATPALQVIVGRTVGPTSSFVRLPGAETVYRAAVGPRQRYDQAAADWRDRVVLSVDKDTVTALNIQQGSDIPRGRATLALTRSPTAPSAPPRWTIAGVLGTAPDSAASSALSAAIDSAVVESVARALGHIRAGDIHNTSFPGGFEAPIAIATLTTASRVHRIVLGSASDDKTAFVKVDERPEVFAVSGQLTRMLTQPALAYRNREIFAFDPTLVRRLALTEGSITVEIERGADATTDSRSDGRSDGTTSWNVLRPLNMDVDDGLADKLTGSLSALRASGIPDGAAFVEGPGGLLITFADGSTRALDFGQPERDGEGRQVVRVRSAGSVYQIRVQTLDEIERVFGR
ncbi:MAG: DUF4340 domain-containing protein [Myxococcales bacterium]|nr:DUF4340 domain-containing protein [Myxococcales bacterium]